MSIKYHLAEDTIDHKDIDRLVAWLKTYPRLTKGQVTVQFEEKWSQWLGQKYSLFNNSGSSANLLMYDTLLLSNRLKNKKVVVPSVGWVTTVAPAIQFGFEPLMCEADQDTFGLDLNHLEDLLKKHNPSTVVLVQVLGVPHKMMEIMALKEKYGFFLLEDACAALGASYQGQKVGTFGEMSSFSFYFGHQFSTIEGGMVSTNDKQFLDILRMMRSHGWSKDLDRPAHEALVQKYQVNDFHSPFVFYEPGFNLRSTDLQAHIGLGQLEKAEWIISRRQENHSCYIRHLGSKFYVQKPPAGSVTCSISFGMLAHSTEERQAIVNALVANGIETRIFSAGNLGLHPFWYNRYGKFSAPMADKIHHCGLFLPNNPSLKLEDVDFISQVVLNSVQKSNLAVAA
ncbi:MAG: DegT/DnrJ/EryC1/StrS family aminotransferase [Elusimicrobia bacterium]|nr:DegT/DnrJ/EryC1/StrS family aminotransferase [Elusimicrobiota bacterium]